jgi:hypothetical protein
LDESHTIRFPSDPVSQGAATAAWLAQLPEKDFCSTAVSKRGPSVQEQRQAANHHQLGVPTKVLVQAVKRNADRFPDDFMFQLDASEWESLRSQSVTSNIGRGGRRYAPYAFTEQGVAMLSSVLGSAQAIAVNIEIMRAFVRLREVIVSNKELAARLDDLENKSDLMLTLPLIITL